MRKVFLLLTLVWFCTGGAGSVTKIKGSKNGNWWGLGETVKFAPVSPGDYTNNPAGKITGIVYDLENNKAAEITVSAGQFVKSGWTWKPEKPGFYKIIFSIDGKAIENSYEFSTKAENKQYRKLFFRKYHNVVVAAEKTPVPSKISPQFGMAPHDNLIKMVLPLSRYIGFNCIRYHMVHWDLIEKKQGKYSFKGTDKFIKLCKKYGYSQDRIVMNVYGTPYWASSVKSRKYYVVPAFAAAPPEKMSYWTDFLTVLAKRYPKINKWELWNEPSLPGRSLYWSGTPEEYSQMFISGSKAIKKINPDSKFYMYSGLGTTAFFEHGVAKYTDFLSIHGTSNNYIKGLDKWLKDHGAKAKPWVNLEWHIALLRSDKDLSRTDSILVKNMIIYFVTSLSCNAKAFYAFCMTNNVERENLEWMKDNNIYSIDHCSGFFRKKPYIEPRLLACVWHNFTTCFSGDVTFHGDYSFNKNKQTAVVLNSDLGPVLFFWNSEKQPSVIAPELLKAAGPKSVCYDWEGRSFKPEKGMIIPPDAVYWIKSPDMTVVKSWKNGHGLILAKGDKTNKNAATISTAVDGVYYPGRLFAKDWNILDKKNLKWLNAGKYVSVNGQSKPQGLSVRFAMGMNKDGLDLLIEVKDTEHVQNATDRKVWYGDSVQFAIDPTGNASHKDNRIEFSAALKKSGAELWKEWAPDLGGDLPDKYTPAQHQVKYGKIKIEKIPVILPLGTKEIEIFLISESKDTTGWFDIKDFKVTGVTN